MYRVALLFLLLGFNLTIIRSKTAASAGSYQNEPMPDTPHKLAEVWLRFHEADLCQGIDAVFVFNKGGMEVWSVVEDERSYQRFLGTLEPLRDSFRIELYAIRPPPERKSDDDRDPFPSLWENYELRANLGDPIAQDKLGPALERFLSVYPPDEILKQRLLIYTEQTLDRNRRMERYAADLPALARMAFDSAVDPRLRLLANAVCLAHAQNLEKYIGKLDTSLRQALPKTNRKSRTSPQPDKSSKEAKVPVDSVVQISEAAHGIAKRVHYFIHPEHYTVGLDELRKPSLLELLEELQRLTGVFQRAVGIHAPK
jgi:hypothetical protein